jgi:hypothetical protein
MAETTTTSTATATPPPSSATTQTDAGSSRPDNVIDFTTGPGPDLLADDAQTVQVTPKQDSPAPTGELPKGDATKEDKKDEQPKADADPVSDTLKYYENLNIEKPVEGVKPETTEAPDAFKTIDANREKIVAALKTAGLDDKGIEQFNNYHKLIGQQSAERHQLKQQREQYETTLKPVLEFDEAGGVKGFNGLKILEMATEKYGKEGVQEQLAAAGLKLVPANFREAAPEEVDSTVEFEAIKDVAKQFKIDSTDLNEDELRTLVSDNPKAQAALTRKLARLEYENATRSQQETAKTQAEQQAEVAQVKQLLDNYATSMPKDHWDVVKPAMSQLWAKYYAKGTPNVVQVTEILRLAGEALSFPKRMPKLIEQVRAQERQNLFQRLGIKENDLRLMDKPKQQVSTVVTAPKEFEDDDITGPGPDLMSL